MSGEPLPDRPRVALTEKPARLPAPFPPTVEIHRLSGGFDTFGDRMGKARTLPLASGIPAVPDHMWRLGWVIPPDRP